MKRRHLDFYRISSWQFFTLLILYSCLSYFSYFSLTWPKRPSELLTSLGVRPSSVVNRPFTIHIFIFSSETAGPISTKLCWNGPWMVPFQNYIRGLDRPSNMAAVTKNRKSGVVLEKSSPPKLLSQLKPNFGEMVLRYTVVLFKNYNR